MKKNYFKPEFVAVEIACDSVMNETSRITGRKDIFLRKTVTKTKKSSSSGGGGGGHSSGRGGRGSF